MLHQLFWKQFQVPSKVFQFNQGNKPSVPARELQVLRTCHWGVLFLHRGPKWHSRQALGSTEFSSSLFINVWHCLQSMRNCCNACLVPYPVCYFPFPHRHTCSRCLSLSLCQQWDLTNVVPLGVYFEGNCFSLLSVYFFVFSKVIQEFTNVYDCIFSWGVLQEGQKFWSHPFLPQQDPTENSLEIYCMVGHLVLSD